MVLVPRILLAPSGEYREFPAEADVKRLVTDGAFGKVFATSVFRARY
jgi:hypothetical protein